MSNGGHNPGGRVENRVKRLITRYELATNPKKKRHNLTMIMKACWHARRQLRAIALSEAAE